jgi:hypothetical protein
MMLDRKPIEQRRVRQPDDEGRLYRGCGIPESAQIAAQDYPFSFVVQDVANSYSPQNTSTVGGNAARTSGVTPRPDTRSSRSFGRRASRAMPAFVRP